MTWSFDRWFGRYRVEGGVDLTTWVLDFQGPWSSRYSVFVAAIDLGPLWISFWRA